MAMKTILRVDGSTATLDRKAIIDLMTGSTSVSQLVEERKQLQVANSILKARIAEERKMKA